MCFIALAGVVGAVIVRPSTASVAHGAAGAPQDEDALKTWGEHESGRFRVAFGVAMANVQDVWLIPNEPLDIPDLLVYAVTQVDVEGATELPADARLLGPAAQATPTLLKMTVNERGLLLFSLAHQAVEASISFPDLGQFKDGEDR